MACQLVREWTFRAACAFFVGQSLIGSPASAQTTGSSLASDAELVISTGTTFTALDASLTINDAGTVGFVGSLPDGSSAPYVVSTKNTPIQLTLGTSPTRLYNGAA